MSIPLNMAVITMPKKLNMAPYPYRNKFCTTKSKLSGESKYLLFISNF